MVAWNGAKEGNGIVFAIYMLLLSNVSLSVRGWSSCGPVQCISIALLLRWMETNLQETVDKVARQFCLWFFFGAEVFEHV